MGIFSWRKKNTQEEPKELEIPVLPHVCVWKDLPWYMKVRYSGTEKWAEYEIVEPYICIAGCGARKNVVLETERWSNIDADTREEYYAKVRKKYRKYLKPRAIVEDMINNILLVKDPTHLEHVEIMKGTPHRNVGTSAEMKQVKDTTEYKINIPERKKE